MRSAVLVASALAIGAIAKPIEKRYYVTNVDLTIKTVTVMVTPGAAEPTVAAVSSSRRHGYGGGYHHYHSKASSSSAAASAGPASSSQAPVFEEPEPSSVYTPPVPSTPTPTPTPTPEPTQEPVYSSAVVTSEAPVSSAPAYNGDHPTGTAQATLSSGPDYQAAVLYHHNAARANHNAEPLVWDSACEEAARAAADRCNFKHYFPPGVEDQGQNIFTNSGDAFNVTAGITESWYKGEIEAMAPYWGMEVPDAVFHSVGHLTQMVWKDTTKVGCVSKRCDKMTVEGDDNSPMNMFTVCNYAKPGNYKGEYANNVEAPISTTNLGSWSD